jgi:small neutral amino acid transporter SnatA (MarC family)
MTWNPCSRLGLALLAVPLAAGPAAASAVVQTTPEATEPGGLLDVLPFVLLGVLALVLVTVLLYYLRRPDEPQDPLA